MEIVVTGAAGFLGSHLCEYHLRQGDRVWGVDNFCTGLASNVELLQQKYTHFKFFKADVVSDWSTWFAKPEPIKRIYHFASPASPPHYQRLGLETMAANSVGLANALSWADRFGAKCVFASTSEIYGDPTVHPQPETYWGNVNTLGPRACYDESKRFGEALIVTHNQKYKTKHGMVRIFNTYGPRMNPADGRVVINLLTQGLSGSALTVYGDGSQSRSFCFVSDLIDAIVNYANKKELVEPVNIGNDSEFTILQLAQQVQNIFQEKNLKITHEPLPKDDPRQRRPDLRKAKDLLRPWSPKISLDEGLRLTLQWLIESGVK